MISKLLNAFEDNSVINIKNFIEIESGWGEFIDLINTSYQMPLEWKLTEEQSELFDPVGYVKFYDKLTMMISQVHYSNLKEVQKVKDIISDSRITIRAAAAAVSLTNCEKTTRKHADPVNVLHIQCIGQTTWEVWPNEIYQSYSLNPGDAIFVPSKTYHEVTSLTPRTGLTFAIDLD
jgi:mannose-6-phosphate isomerase class I